MKLKNASLMEKHVKSQADEESFNAREAVAAQRRKEDRVNRVQMMGEREKNRQRKLKAVGGREWDMEKNQEDFAGDDGRRARRGAHGGIAGDGLTPNGREWQIKGAAGRGGPDDSARGRGRGKGRGEDRGRGRGHGGSGTGNSERPQKEKPVQAPPKASDFVPLPAPTAKPATDDNKGPIMLEFPIKPKSTSYAKAAKSPDAKTSEAKPPRSLDALVSPTGEKKSWADQVEGATG